MKKKLSKALALAMAALMTLSACSSGSSNSGADSSAKPEANQPASSESSQPAASTSESSQPSQSADSISDLVYYKLSTRELETFNVLYSQRAEDSENLTNIADPLLEVNTYGELVPALAEEWSSDDGGKTWTFKVREGVSWVDMNGSPKADITAHDWATGLEWVLNFHKNDSANTSMPIEMIEGAEEYYEWTKTLSADEAYALTGEDGSKFREMVGLETPDDYTLVYHCIVETPYFPSVATYTCLYPMNAGMVEELGGVDNVKSMNNTNMWYSGCYTMTSYIQGNEKVFTKNPLYWDKEASLFDTVTVKMVESNDVAFQLYQAGEIDYVTLTESNLMTIYNNENHEFHDYLVPDVPSKYCYQFHLNYNKKLADGTPDTNWNTAVANENFRRSIYSGLDLKEYYKRTNAINPMAAENNSFTMPGLVYTSDGVEYSQLVKDELGLKVNGETMARLDSAKAEEYKAKAIEELTALGVTFPVAIDYYISASSQTALDSANVLKQAFSNSLGDDYVVLNINTYVSSVRQEVVNPHLHSFVINGWGADYGDPQNYLGQVTYGGDNAYYSANYSYINEITEETEVTKDLLDAYKEFTRLVEEANAINTDMDARYKAYAVAEAYLLDKALVIPSYLSVPWALSKVDNSSRMKAPFGIQDPKYKNWKTNVNGYTTEEAEANEAAKAAAK